jgi:hypothetical protein
LLWNREILLRGRSWCCIIDDLVLGNSEKF